MSITLETTAMKPVAVKLPDEARERIARLAAARDRSPHWLMKEAILEYLDREERREAFRDACHQAWEHYDTTGLHATHEEANAWLEQLALGNNVEPPKCHT